MNAHTEPIAAHLLRVEQSFALHLGPLAGLDTQSPVDILLGKQDPPGTSRPPLQLMSPGERALYQDLLTGIRSCNAGIQQGAELEWYQGRFFYLCRAGELWRRDPETAHLSFVDFACLVSGMTSRHPAERRMILGRHFTLPEYLSFLARGVCPSLMCAIYRSDPRLWGTLREVVFEHPMTVEEFGQIRRQGEQMLKQREGLDDETIKDELHKKAREQAGKGRKQKERRNQARSRDNDDEDGHDDGEPGDRRDEQDDEALQKAQLEIRALRGRLAQAEEAQRQAQAQAAKAQAQVEEIKAQAQAQGATVDARIEEARAQAQAQAQEALTQAQEALAQTQAQVEQLKAELAQAQQEIDRLQKENQDLRARLDAIPPTVEEAYADLDTKAAQLTAKQAEIQAQAEQAARDQADQAARLAREQADLQDRIAQAQTVLTQAEALQRKQQELDAAQIALSEERERLANIDQGLREREARLDKIAKDLTQDVVRVGEADFRIGLSLHERSLIRWRDDPFSPDGIVLSISDHCARVAELLDKLLDFSDEGKLPLHGRMPMLWEAAENLKGIMDAAQPTLTRVMEEFEEEFPDETRRFMELVVAKQHERLRVEEAKLGRPASRFKLQTRVLLGTREQDTAQQGVLGFTEEGELATMDLDDVQSMVILGEPNYGKTNTIEVMIENVISRQENLNDLKEPFGVTVTHWGPDPYAPGPRWADAFKANNQRKSVEQLCRMGVMPRGLRMKKGIVFVPPMDEGMLERRRAHYAPLEVQVLGFGPADMTLEIMMSFMGTHKNAPLYMRTIGDAVGGLVKPTPEQFIAAVEGLKFRPDIEHLVHERLSLMRKFLGHEVLRTKLEPGVFIGLDMRAPYLDEETVMTLFSAAMTVLSQAAVIEVGPDGVEKERKIMKMLVVDEAHKLMKSKRMVATLVRMNRERRHLRQWILLASQDPDSLDGTVLDLPSVTVVHRLKSMASIKEVAKHNLMFEDKEVQRRITELEQGEAFILVNESSDPMYRTRPQKIRIRPTSAMPTGTTEKAVSDKDRDKK